jgi:hypothetical protein
LQTWPRADDERYEQWLETDAMIELETQDRGDQNLGGLLLSYVRPARGEIPRQVWRGWGRGLGNDQ